MSATCTLADAVAIPKGAFVFCRYTMTVLIWTAFILKAKLLMVVLFGLLALSAILTIRHAPLVWIYSVTINKLWPSADERLSVSGMRVAHGVGTGFAGLCLLFLYGLHEPTGWWLTLGYCIIKTISAIWACPVYKLYACMKSGDCCTFLKRKTPTIND
jgi:hypothetical protein